MDILIVKNTIMIIMKYNCKYDTYKNYFFLLSLMHLNFVLYTFIYLHFCPCYNKKITLLDGLINLQST
jgi:hypothetical protein